MKKTFIIICGIILAIVIACPLLLYFFVLEQVDFLKFLTDYIAVVIGAVISIVGMFITISYTEKQFSISKKQFDEQNRLNNRPILDLQIVDICEKNDDTISMNCEYTFNNAVSFQEAVVKFQVFNVGLGAALDIKYGIKINEKMQDGVFWNYDNHILKKDEDLYQRIALLFPENEEFSLDLLLFYDDVLNNHYVKTVRLINKQTENGTQMLCVLFQDKGKVCNIDIKNMYYVVTPMETNEIG